MSEKEKSSPSGSAENSRLKHCQFCKATFTQNVIYYKHANTQHKDLVTTDWSKCKQCDNYFPCAKSLKKHGQTHNKKNDSEDETNCDFCSEPINSQTEYIEHANRLHSAEISALWIQCEVCQKYFITQPQLDTHTKQKHATDQKNGEGHKNSNNKRKSLRTRGSKSRLSRVDDDSTEVDPLTFLTCSYEGEELGGNEPRKKKRKRNVSNVHDNGTRSSHGTNGDTDSSKFDPAEFLVNHFLELKQDDNSLDSVKADDDDEDYVAEDSDDEEEGNYDDLLDRKKVSMTPGKKKVLPQGIDCEYCMKTFPTRKLLNKHKRKAKCHLKLGLGPGEVLKPKCKICHKTFTNRKGLLTHRRDVICFPKPKPKIIGFAEDGAAIISSEEPISQCELCQKVFTNRKSMKLHQRRVKCTLTVEEEDPAKMFQCPHCERTYKSEKHMNLHIEGIHTELDVKPDIKPEISMLDQYYASLDIALDPTLEPPLDSTKEPTLDSVLDQLCSPDKSDVKVKVAIIKNFKCLQCHTKYKTRPELSKHSQKYNHACSFDCEKCQVSYTNLREYVIHTKTESHQKGEVDCKYCYKRFADKKTLGRHIRRTHEIEKNFACQECSKTFLLKHELGYHCNQNNHFSVFGCEKCPGKFDTYEEYKEHMNYMHAKGSKNVPLLIPGHPLKPDQLLPPKSSVPKPNPTECTECGYRFAHRSALIKHLRNVHNEQIILTPPNKPLKLVEKPAKPLPPAPADMNTDESTEINTDELTELKPFAKKTKVKKVKVKPEKICEFCDKGFATNQKLKTHIKNVHAGTKYPCRICGKNLCDKSKLKTHISNFHPDYLADFLSGSAFWNQDPNEEGYEGDGTNNIIPLEEDLLEGSSDHDKFVDTLLRLPL